MDDTETSVELLRRGYNCAQAVLATLGPDYGVDRDTCLALAAPFGAGMCKRADICGAVTGALLALGLRDGRMTIDDPEKKRLVYDIGNEFNRRFVERNGSLICRELLGCDISTPEGMAEARENDYHRTRCVRFVRDAVEIVLETRNE